MIRAKQLASALALSLTIVGAVVGTASATIDFTPGNRFSIGRVPRYAAAGNFSRRDLLFDLAVSSSPSDEVTALINDDREDSDPFSFERGTVVRGFYAPGRVKVGQLNTTDNFEDLAIVDDPAKGVWIVLGRGDGTFDAPYLVIVPSQLYSPQDVALADMTGDGVTDMIITDSPRNGKPGQVLIMANDGNEPPAFSLVATVQVGVKPEDVIVSDFNGDGWLDIAMLDTGGLQVKDVTVLLNLGPVSELGPKFADPVLYPVGKDPFQMVLGDFNNDGIADLMMGNNPKGFYHGEVQFLFGTGSGRFNGPVNVPASCPFVESEENTCKARAVTMGDYDQDGYTDVLVAMGDSRQGSLNHHFLALRQARPGGRFIPKRYFDTPKWATATTTADYTGDSFVDVALSTGAVGYNSFVQLWVNGSITPQQPGTTCGQDDQCDTEVCEDGYCCDRRCDPEESCSVPEHEGTCTELFPRGDPCTADRQCFDGHCVDGVCCNTACTDPDQRCDIVDHVGTCTDTLYPPDPCTKDSDCKPLPPNTGDFGYCVDGICCHVEACAIDEQCLPPDGECHPRHTPTPAPGKPGDECGDNEIPCEDGLFCTDGVCCEVAHCESGTYCGDEGVCVEGTRVPTKTRTPTRIPSATPTEPASNIQHFESRGGGCAIVPGRSPASLGGLLLIALAPAGLWFARRRRRDSDPTE